MLPQAVDSPIFEHAGNYTGHRIRPVPPTLGVDEVAAGIEACAENPKREVTCGRAGRTLELVHALSPALLFRRVSHRAFLRGTMAADGTALDPGNVLASRRPTRSRAAGGAAAAGPWREPCSPPAPAPSRAWSERPAPRRRCGEGDEGGRLAWRPAPSRPPAHGFSSTLMAPSCFFWNIS